MERTLSDACGTRCCSRPLSSSRCAKSFIVSRKEPAHSRVGSACGSSRALEVSTKTSSSARAPGSSSCAGSSAVVAAGSYARTPYACAASCAPSASVSATLDACAAHAE